jgi:pyruvate dehydrogenase kinase 2/3/4
VQARALRAITRARVGGDAMTAAVRQLLRSSLGAAEASFEAAAVAGAGTRLQDTYSPDLVNDIFRHAIKKQTGVSLKYMLDFGQRPIEKQMILSAQFLRQELPIRLAHRVAELENLPFGLSTMRPILKARLK